MQTNLTQTEDSLELIGLYNHANDLTVFLNMGIHKLLLKMHDIFYLYCARLHEFLSVTLHVHLKINLVSPRNFWEKQKCIAIVFLLIFSHHLKLWLVTKKRHIKSSKKKKKWIKNLSKQLWLEYNRFITSWTSMFNLLYYEHWTGKRKYFYVIMVRSKLRDSFVHHKTEKKQSCKWIAE